MHRRTFLTLLAAAASAPALSASPLDEAARMHGLIGKMRAVPGQRAALAAILLEGTRDMPGCLAYVVAEDPADDDALWITEVWDNAASHQASLQLPAVRDAIARGRPLIAAFESQVQTRPLGGHGLAAG